jgi:hypothetical protein
MRIGHWSIVEQLQGSCDFKSVTDNLKKGFWPNYNAPYISTVREKSSAIGSINKNLNLTDLEDYVSHGELHSYGTV